MVPGSCCDRAADTWGTVMSDKYKPTTEQVRAAFCVDIYGDYRQEWGQQFDRWLNQVKAEAWDEGYGSDLEATVVRKNPYRSQQ